MKYFGLILLALALLMMAACADTSSSRYRNRDSMVDLANNCAMCGATVSDNYFFGSAARAVGPGNY
ncbi:MAG: hypothetical protein P8168_01030 [Deltaproteobacteria bacterium]|jgi:hypothetical protein